MRLTTHNGYIVDDSYLTYSIKSLTLRNCSLLFSDFEANLQILSELKVKKHNMALEIERKYLVVSDSYRALAEKSSHIRQGYLSRDKERTVRVRIVDDKLF